MKILFKRAALLLVIFGTLAQGGCGGTSAGISAPPVDLPAPITGRVDVSAPDADGNVSITGSEGAVPAGSMVLVVNESTSGGVAFKILDALVPSAHAQESDLFPPICSEPGHACAVAGEDGSFLIIIAAAIGDQLAIGIIDPETGEFISELLRMPVPAVSGDPGSGNLSVCAGEGVTGAVKDIVVAPNNATPVLLLEGSETTTNEIIIGYQNPVVIPISGCHAHSIEAFAGIGSDFIAVTSKEDKLLWLGSLEGTSITDQVVHHLNDEPMHAAFVLRQTDLIFLVTMKTASSVEVAQIDLTTGATVATMALLANNLPIQGLARSVALDIHEMGIKGTPTEHYLGVLVADKGSSTDPASTITLFQADGLVHKVSWNRAEVNGFNPINGEDAESFVDAAPYVFTAGNAEVRIAMVDAAGATYNSVIEYNVTCNYQGVMQVVMPDYDLANISTCQSMDYQGRYPAAGAEPLLNIAIREKTGMDTLLLSSNAGGNLYRVNIDAILPMMVEMDWKPAADIIRIDVDTTGPNNILFGADADDAVSVYGSGLLVP